MQGVLMRFFGRRSGPAVVAVLSLLLAVPALPATPGEASRAPAGSKQAEQGLLKLDIEQLATVPLGNVYGASKTKQKAAHAPATVSIVTANDIKKYGYRTLADILRSARGFYVTGDRNYSYVGVRGFGRPADYNSRLLVLVDGHRVNEPLYMSTYVGSEFILDVDLIDRVELIRGPSSSLYGTGAFFGIVNVITKESAALGKSEASGDAGSLGTLRGRLTLNHRTRHGTSIIASATRTGRQGNDTLYYREYDNAFENSGRATRVDGEDAGSQFAKIQTGDFTLELAHVKRDKTVPTGYYETVFNSPENRATDQQEYADLRYEHTWPKDLTVMARAHVNRYRYSARLQYDTVGNFDPADYVLMRDEGRARWYGGEAQVTKRFSKTRQLILGGEYQNVPQVDQWAYDEQPYAPILDERHRYQQWGVYLEGETDLARWLSLNAGVRFDRFSTFGDTTNPRIALIASPKEGTLYKLLYGTAFRAPNYFELYYGDGGITQKANPALKPETISTYEAVWEQRIDDNLRGSLAYYYYQMQGLVDQLRDPADGLLTYFNTEPLDAKGVELELDGRWPDGREGRFSVAVQKARNMVTDRELTNSPRLMAKLNLLAPFDRRRFYLGFEGQYVSSRLTVARDDVPACFLTNVTLFTDKLVKDLELSVSVYNLFDTQYSDPSAGPPQHRQDSILQDGRTCRFKATARF